jgi:uncharacterized protein (DUF1778 family)
MARPPKDPALVKSVDLRIPVTHDQKVLIHKAAYAEQSDVASWARGILVKAAQAVVKKEERKER